MRWLKRVGIAVLVVVVLGVGYLYVASSRKLDRTLDGHTERLVASALPLPEVERRVRTLGCFDCHGAGLKGDKFIDIPRVVTLNAPNLTQVAAIATDQQIARAIRQGIGHDGRPLMIMPSISYRHLSDQETADVVRYIRSLPTVGAEQPGVSVGPLGRLAVIKGDFEFQPDLIARHAGQQIPDLGPATASGRHLVNTHCSDCHGVMLDGGEPEPGVKAPDLAIAAAYDDAMFVRLLRTGVPADGRKLKTMGDVSRINFTHLTDAEIAAIHAYLKARADVAAK